MLLNVVVKITVEKTTENTVKGKENKQMDY